jgi:hypothetical protein
MSKLKKIKGAVGAAITTGIRSTPSGSSESTGGGGGEGEGGGRGRGGGDNEWGRGGRGGGNEGRSNAQNNDYGKTNEQQRLISFKGTWL